MRALSLHYNTTLKAQNQPHTITVHLEFLRRTSVGPAKFVVRDVKRGRQTSICHVTLIQEDREEVVGYFTNTNLETEKGPSFETGWTLHPPTRPVDLQALKRGDDKEWTQQAEMPFANFRKASQRVKWFFPRQGQPLKSVSDEWLTFTTGERFTQESLGFLCDMFPQVVENYHHDDPYTVSKRSGKSKPPAAMYWSPTLLLNLDVKKALPKEGVEFLFIRAQTKKIQNGRIDLEIIIMDEEGDVVALSHHVTLVLGTERNLAKRKVKEGSSKI